MRKKIVDRSSQILIGEIEGKPVGVVRFDREQERATVSIYLVPGNYGKGIGPNLLEEGISWVRKNWEIKFVDAVINKNNSASISAFLSAGFEEHLRTYTKQIRN